MDEKKMEENTVVKPSGDGNEKTGLQALLTKRNIIIVAIALIVAVVLLVVLTSSPSPKAVIGDLKLGMKPEKVMELIGEPDSVWSNVEETGEGYYHYRNFQLLEEVGDLSISFTDYKADSIAWTSKMTTNEDDKLELMEKLSDHVYSIYGSPNPNIDDTFDKSWFVGNGKNEALISVGEPYTGSEGSIQVWCYSIALNKPN